MRIEPGNIIRITGRAGLADLLSEARKGGDVPARIVDRLGAREAVLEIAGTRIRAEFLKGVPDSGAVTLRLDTVRHNTVTFRMIDPALREEALRQILDLTLLRPDEPGGKLLHDLAAALAKPPAGIYEFNARLLGLPPERGREEGGLARFLNHLLRLGAGHDMIADLALILSGSEVPSRALLPLVGYSGHGDGRGRKKDGKSGDPAGAARRIAAEIVSLPDPAAREELIGLLLGLLREAGSCAGGVRRGEIAWYQDGAYHPIRYMGTGSGWLFSLDLSALGRVEILARESGAVPSISVFTEVPGAVEALMELKGALLEQIEKASPGAVINFYNTRLAIQKIVEINSRYCLNSVFDVKV